MAYDDYYSEEKEKVNDIIAQEFAKCPGSILYLDSLQLRTTQAFQNQDILCNLTIVEINKEYYTKMTSKADELGIHIYHGDIFDYILKINPRNLYLDLCSSDIQTKDIRIVKKWLQGRQDANLFITLCSRSGKKRSTFAQRRARLKRTFSQLGYKAKLIYGYQRKYKSPTMMVMQFMYGINDLDCGYRPQKCSKIIDDYYYIKCWCYSKYEPFHKDSEMVQTWLKN